MDCAIATDWLIVAESPVQNKCGEGFVADLCSAKHVFAQFRNVDWARTET